MLKNTVIVGLGHRARHGKDTVAKLLHASAPFDTKVYSFAAALKTFCRVNGWMTSKDGPLLQRVGTEVFRECVDPELWVRVLELEIGEDAPRVAIIPDMRFKNEKRFVEQRGLSVRIERRLADGSLYVDPSRPATHKSEIDLAGESFDYSFTASDGGLPTLYEAAKTLRSALISKNSLPDETLDERLRAEGFIAA